MHGFHNYLIVVSMCLNRMTSYSNSLIALSNLTLIGEGLWKALTATILALLPLSSIMLTNSATSSASLENTNAMDLIGRKARVTAEINNQLSKGAAVVNGQEWTARAAEEEAVIPEGEIVLIKEIRGVKLIVDRIKEEK